LLCYHDYEKKVSRCYFCVFSSNVNACIVRSVASVLSTEMFFWVLFLSWIFYFILHLHLNFLSPFFCLQSNNILLNLSFISPYDSYIYQYLLASSSFTYHILSVYILKNHIFTHTTTSRGLQFIYIHICLTFSYIHDTNRKFLFSRKLNEFFFCPENISR